MSYLEFQDEMYTDVVNDDACLVIASRGLGLEQLMVRLCRTYSDDTNLVIVIGTDIDDELFIQTQLSDENDIPIGKMPQSIRSESANTKKRTEIYLKGGVLFVTERILVVDLLKDRVPVDLITGFIVYKAHRIDNDCIMAFVLRLYREKNKKGFVKALSESPHSFFGDYQKLDKIMRMLFVTSLHLWPRFHASVQASLGKPRVEPDVIELNLPMSQTMKDLQFDIMDLIDRCLKELAKTNNAFLCDSEKLNVENAICTSFDNFVKRRFDVVWHQLGTRAIRLINDIQWLRNLLNLLTQSDVVTFYNQTRAANNSIRTGRDISDWITWQPATRLFKLAKERVYPNNTKMANFDAETNLKWRAFEDIIDEIDSETKDVKSTINVFIITASDWAAHTLQSVLSKGASSVLKERFDRFEAILRSNNVSDDALQLFGLQHDIKETEKREAENPDKAAPTFIPAKKRFKKQEPVQESNEPANFTLTQIWSKNKQPTEIIDLETVGVVKQPGSNVEKNKHELKLHYFCSRSKTITFEMELREHNPMHFIMYDLDPHVIRQIEVYQALRCSPKRCRVYTIQFEKSWDMQRYLTSLRREKEAFESLIREKSTMVIPMGRDGKVDGHPDLVRGGVLANETTDPINTRKAGGQIERNAIIQQKILVDVREFRCELPGIIHKRGIDVDPILLDIGDYILSSDTCVERKSVSDLIQSLQSGRLFNQASAMLRHFTRAILLIEFDANKSFHFKGRYWGMQATKPTAGGSRRDYSLDLVDRLILLTIHHPNLRIIWSPSTHFSAELFECLKVDRDQPDAATVLSISSQELPPESFEDRYDLEARNFLLKLPGVNSRNVYALMTRVQTLAELADLEREELEELLGSSRSAELLHSTLNESLGKIINQAICQERDARKTKLFACSKQKKSQST